LLLLRTILLLNPKIERPMRYLLPVCCLVFPWLAMAQPLDINARHQRFTIQLDASTASVELCQLQPGETYRLRLSAPEDQGCPASFSPTDGNYAPSPATEIIATDDCMTIPLFHQCANQYYSLTVSRISGTAKPKPRQRLNSIETVDNNNANFLIEDVFIGGGCFDVSGATASGSPGQIGTFSNGTASINLEEGIILSSGDISLSAGPNSAPNITQGYNNASTDPDLAQLAGGPFFDRAAITFSFQPTVSVVTFEYAFASDEYCEYVNTQFNDVFGFFISGPGITGPFSNGAINIAQVPGSGDFVSINTVNQFQNTPFYNDNAVTENCAGGAPVASAFIEYDGFTEVFTAVANVIPCETYTIKLVIADRGDDIYDSAVFLKANSFNGGQLASSDVTISGLGAGSNAPYEGCSDGFFIFTREDLDTSEPFVINFNVSPLSTATPGLDYAPFPSSVVIPAGETQVTLFVDIFADLIAEGVESIIVELSTPCSCTSNTVELLITDPPPLQVLPEPPLFLCENAPTTLTPTVTGGLPGYSYLWDNGSMAPSINVQPDEQTSYTVTVTDQCGQVTVGLFDVVPFTPTATLSGSGAICEQGSFDADLVVNFSGPAPFTLTYSVDGFTETIDNIFNNVFQLPASIPGTYELIAVSSQGCPGDVFGQAVIEVTAIDIAANAEDNSCFGEEDGTIVVEPTGGNGPYDFSWSGLPGDATVTTGDSTQTISDLPPGDYSLTVTDINGCINTTALTIDTPAELIATTAGVTNIDCSNIDQGAIETDISGGSGTYSFMWNNGDTTQNLSSLPAGDYALTVTDAAGCTDALTATVTSTVDYPVASIADPDTLDCTTAQLLLDASVDTTGIPFSYSWTNMGGNIISDTTLQDISIDAPGDYTLIVTNTDNQCADTTSIAVIQDIADPIADAGPDTILNCLITEWLLDGGDSDQGSIFAYSWSSVDGSFISTPDSIVVQTEEPGTYLLTVVNTQNGCSAVDTVLLSQDIIDPIVAIATPGIINCTTDTIILDATGSDQGDIFDIQWSTPDGQISSPADSLLIAVNQGGSYTLDITNTENGCSQSATVLVDQDQTAPIADAGPPLELDCETSSATLSAGNSSSNGNFSYVWSTPDGIIESGANSLSPVVMAAGTYVLEVTNLDNGCTATSAVVVSENSNAPIIALNADGILDCDTPTLLIDAGGSDTGAGFSLQWTDAQGTILPTSGPTLEVDQPGLYSLEITNTNNSCVSTASIVIDQDILAPVAEAGPGATLTCSDPAFILDGAASDQGGVFTFTWSTPDGQANIPAVLTPTIQEPGTYFLTIVNTQNSCSTVDSVIILADQIIPDVQLSPGGELNCATQSFSLEATVDNAGTNPVYDWMTLSGNIDLPDGQLQHQIDEGGTFELVVTNTENGCTSSEQVVFTQNIETPVADAGAPFTLTCNDPQFTIDASVTNQQGALAFAWTTTNGNIVSGADDLQPLVDAPGNYQLIVTNTASQCSDTTFVEIDQDIEAPVVDAGQPQTLTCDQPSVVLQGNGQTAGNALAYSWTTADGTIEQGANTPNPVTQTPGTYVLEVTNLANGCVATDAVLIDLDQAIPVADAGPDGLLNCATPSFALNALANAGSATNNPALSISWNTLSGSQALANDQLQQTLMAPGSFELVVVNTTNGCEQRDTFALSENFDTPTAETGPGELLTCTLTTTTLGGGATSTGPNLAYQWLLAGSTISGANAPTLPIDTPGAYELIVTNTESFCADTSAVTVLQDIAAPQVDAGPSATLTCDITTLTLNGSASTSAGNFAITWTTTDGILISAANTLNPVIGAAGNYTMSVEDLSNGCISTDVVAIIEDQFTPIIDVGPDLTLNCANTSLSAQAAVLQAEPDYTLTWTLNGTDYSNALNPSFSNPGVYVLEIVNAINGCSRTDTLTVSENFAQPEALAAPPEILTCTQTTVILDGTPSSSGAQYTYQWTSLDGNVITDAAQISASVAQPGTYQLLVTDQTSFCTELTTVEVLQDVVPPTADAGIPSTLTCANPTASIGNGTLPNAGFSYEWAGPGILSNPTATTISINVPGTYTVTATNDFNGCTTIDQVVIPMDTIAPIAVAGPDEIITCAVPTIGLDGSNSSMGPSYSYTWTDASSNVLSNGLTLDVDIPGNYIIHVLDLNNGCESSDILEVTIDTIAPVAVASVNDILTCDVTSLLLSGTASSTGPAYTYNWSTGNGSTILNSTTTTPTVSAPGPYDLVVTNTINGCATTTSVTVPIDTIAPQLSIAGPAILNCFAPSQTLDAMATGDGPISYSWTTTDGDIEAGAATNMPTVIGGGTYQLVVENQNNGCTTLGSVFVPIDTLSPGASITVDEELTCSNPSIAIEGTTSTGNAVSYSWTSLQGHPITGANTAIPTISEPGTYQLVVIDQTNGCSSMAATEIIQDVLPPVISIVEPAILTCLVDNAILQSETDEGPFAYNYTWTDANGNVLGLDNPDQYSCG
jgi:hypothetical protein